MIRLASQTCGAISNVALPVRVSVSARPTTPFRFPASTFWLMVLSARVSITGLGEITVNRVELLNLDNQVWAHEDVNIKISTGQTGILYWFDFTFTEEKKEE